MACADVSARVGSSCVKAHVLNICFNVPFSEASFDGVHLLEAGPVVLFWYPEELAYTPAPDQHGKAVNLARSIQVINQLASQWTVSTDSV